MCIVRWEPYAKQIGLAFLVLNIRFYDVTDDIDLYKPNDIFFFKRFLLMRNIFSLLFVHFFVLVDGD